MTDAVTICKRALTKIGAGTIASLSESSREARACNRVYVPLRDALLRGHPWNFAMTRTNLAASGDAPDWGYDYEFALPADFMRLCEIKDITDYRLERGKILCDDAGPIYIRYVFKETNPANFDPIFAEALACMIAADICEELTQSHLKKSNAVDELKAALAQARRVDAVENPPEDLDDGAWWDARL